MPLEGAVAFAHPLGQNFDPRAEVNHQVWLCELTIEQAIDALVEHEFIGIEVEPGKDAILGEQVVGHRRLGKEVLLGELTLLIVAGQQEIELDREGVLFRVLVETCDEWIAIGVLEHDARADSESQRLREAGLADADRPFNSNIAPAPLHRAAVLATTSSSRSRRGAARNPLSVYQSGSCKSGRANRPALGVGNAPAPWRRSAARPRLRYWQRRRLSARPAIRATTRWRSRRARARHRASRGAHRRANRPGRRARRACALPRPGG